jgi:hypothetical protein
MNQKLPESLSRRNFIKFCYMLGISATFPSITNCGLNRPTEKQLLNMGLNSSGINISGFQLYNPNNPNQKVGRQKYTFYTKLGNPSPAPAFSVAGGLNIYSAADGKVTDIHKITIGKTRIGGYTVEVSDTLSTPFRLLYYHVEDPVVELMQPVARGDLLAKGASSDRFDNAPGPAYFKLGLMRWHNFEDPDNYGLHHGQMDYWDGKNDLSISDGFQKYVNQRDIITEIVKSYKGNPNPLEPLAKMSEIRHQAKAKKGASTYYWSAVERFRLLDYINTKNPRIFDLNKSEFQGLKDKFYANQPIILTLPFK